jgi:hypothetical protein
MTINGKEVQTRYGMLAAEMVLSKADELSGLSFYSTFGIAHIIWAGIFNHYKVKALPLPVTFEEVYNHVEACDLAGDREAIEAEIREFESSQYLQRKVEQVSEAVEEVKKKIASSTADALPTNPG